MKNCPLLKATAPGARRGEVIACAWLPPYTRTSVEPTGLPPKIRMLPFGETTVAALLRGSLRTVPGNHVSGAAHKPAPTNNGAIPARHRVRHFRKRFVFMNVD